MIESIEIKNFRCFKDTKIAKFGLVNLFGGLNNAGKTALLEAIYLATSPSASSVIFLHRIIRKEENAFIKEKPQNAWDNLFFLQDKKNEILLTSTNIGANKNITKVVIKCDEKIDDLIHFITEGDDEDEDDLEQVFSVLSEKNAIKSALHFDVYNNDNGEYSAILVASKSGIVGRNSSGVAFDNTHFIPASLKLSVSDLAEEYDKARYDGEEELLLQAFQIIDKTIEKVEVFSIGKPLLYLKRKNESRMPIGLFGDAINKIADFILRIINNHNSIVLIDEIENGIHYTNQEKLWKMLFDLAIEFNVQIFATTHSYEMARAFVNVIKENQFNEKAAYFELARHAKTGNIIGTSIPIDILDYDVENNFPFRGE